MRRRIAMGALMRRGLTIAAFSVLLTAALIPQPAGATPMITPSPTSLAFGTLRVGTTQTLTLTVTNTSDAGESLTWNSWAFTPFPTPFAVDLFSPLTTCESGNTAVSLAPNDWCNILVTFTPTKPKSYSGTLELHFGLSSDPQVDVVITYLTVTGRGCKGHGGSGCP